MMDPHRLREQGATSAEKLLLDSASKDGPPEGAAQQLLASLHVLGGQGAGNGLPHTGTQTGAGTLKTATTAWLKVGGLALLGVVGLGAAGVVVGSRAEKTVVARPPVSTPAPPPSTVPEAVVSPPAPAPPIAGETTPSASSDGEARRPPRAAAAEASLGAELRLLALARTAMDDAHDLRAAQRALDGYQRRFPHGRLEPEATVLRLSVLVAQGKTTAARSLGNELLGNDAYRAYQTRIRSLLHQAGDHRTTE